MKKVGTPTPSSARERSATQGLTRNQKITAGIATAAIIISLLVIFRFAVSSSLFKGPTRELDTPGWRLVTDLNAKLAEEHAFVDVGFVVVTETPLKFEIVGAVYSPADMERLKARLKELRPEEDYELNVELMRK